MRLFTMPGVFAPRSDSRMLARAVADRVGPGSSVLDVCTGSGIVAVAAALAGANSVTAVDLSRRAVACAWMNARLNRSAVRVLRGDLFGPLGDERFDLIASNPPYLPGWSPPERARGAARAWEGGSDGRVLIDRICAEAPERLLPGGRILIVHSSICDPDETVRRLTEAGLDAGVAEAARGPFGALLSARAPHLAARGVLGLGEREEEMLVVEAAK
jgi:release factor glutamine methyltransferase